MELHQPFDFGRHRPHEASDFSLSSSSWPHDPCVGPQVAPLPFGAEFIYHPHPSSYGYSSGHQFQYDIQLEPVRKRRRIEGYPSVPSGHQNEPFFFHPSHSMKHPFSSSRGHGDHGHSNAALQPRWQEPAVPSSPDGGSPLARRMADLSIWLCPCCGFGWNQLHGYHAPSEDHHGYYDEPYSPEKMPSAQVQSAEPVQSAKPEALHRTSVSYDERAIVSSPVASRLAQDRPSLHVNVEDAGFQRPSVPDFYPAEPAKQDPYNGSHSVLPLTHSINTDQSPTQFGPMNYGCVNAANSGFPSDSPVETGHALISGHGTTTATALEVWGDVAHQEQQSNFDILLPNQRGGKRGPFKDPGLREQTAQTRKIGSCIRCRMQRIRCEHNPDEVAGDCLTCKKVANTKVGRFPCLRYKVTDVKLHKAGQVPGFEWTRRWNHNISDPIQKWASSDTKLIRIGDGYSSKPIEIRVRQFVPQDGDKLERTWDYNGVKKSVVIPPYALENWEDGKLAYSQHIRDSVSDIFKCVLGRRDGLLHKTYAQAVQLSGDSTLSRESAELLNWTFTLWMSIRLSTRSGSIVGDETLGMNPDILDETNPNHGKIPLPPVLGAQLDLILIHHIQTKLRRDVLDRLQKMILKNKPGTWLVTYLVTFILLHNAALIIDHDASYASKHGMKRRFARHDKVKEYQLGANILLAHFHYCNKGVHPFSDECKDQDLRSLADLDDEQLRFVQFTRSYAKRHKHDWEQLQHQREYENGYYFVGQLFEENWQPRSME